MCFGVAMKGFGRALPPRQPRLSSRLSSRERGDPDVAARVFVNAPYVISNQPVLGRIDSFGARAAELLDSAHLGETTKPLPGSYPPFPQMILESDLIKAPTEVCDMFRKVWPNYRQTLFIVPNKKELVRLASCSETHLTRPRFKDGANIETRPTSFGIGDKSVARQLYRAAASPYPEIARAIFGER